MMKDNEIVTKAMNDQVDNIISDCKERQLEVTDIEFINMLELEAISKALKKEIPQRVIKTDACSQACPICSYKVSYNYCNACGQKLCYSNDSVGGYQGC